MKKQQTIVLRRITEDDTANIVKWRNSASVRKNLYTQTLLTEEQHLRYFRNTVQTGKCEQYIISVNENGNAFDIGTIFIKNIDRVSHKGEFGMFIGEACARGKGFAAQAVSQMLKVAFSELKLNRVYLTVMEDNIPAIRTYEKTGFEKEGILKEDYLRNDGYINVVVMGITERMWRRKREIEA